MGMQIGNNKESVLQEAERLVSGPRAATHGSFSKNCEVACTIFNAWNKDGLLLKPEHVAQIMIAVKMSRQRENPKYRDPYVDAPGYWRLLADLEGV